MKSTVSLLFPRNAIILFEATDNFENILFTNETRKILEVPQNHVSIIIFCICSHCLLLFVLCKLCTVKNDQNASKYVLHAVQL